MDDVVEDWMLPNNTDELDNFAFDLTAWDIVQDTTAIIFTIVGVACDITIILMIARNARMQSKTNILLMNFIINDACYLLCNAHFIASVLELFGHRLHFSYQAYCVVENLDVGFQLNENIFLLIIVSNTLIKSNRIQIKWLLIVVYTVIAVNYVINQIVCQYRVWPLITLMGVMVILINFAVMLVKECNNCYKKWHKKDPLSGRTLFRLHIGRIYAVSWFFTFVMFMFEGIVGYNNHFVLILAQNCYMTSCYVLLYIVYADKNYKICFLNLLHGKGAGDYDVDATITFADDLSEDSQDNNQVNINFNAMENAARSQTQDLNFIRVP